MPKQGAGEGDRRRNVPRVPPTPPAPSLLITNGCRKGSREEEEEEEDEAKSQESPLHILLCRNKEAEERDLLSRWRQQRSRDGSWRGWASGRAPATPPFLSFLSLFPAGYPFLVRRRDRSQSKERRRRRRKRQERPLPPSLSLSPLPGGYGWLRALDLWKG